MYQFNRQYETQYIQQAVGNIIAVLEDEKISGRVARVFRGPASVSITVQVVSTPGQRLTVSMARAVAAAEHIRGLSGLSFIRAVPGNGGVTYEIPAPKGADGVEMVVTPPLDYMLDHIRGRNIPIAVRADNGHPVYLNITEQPNFTAAGPVGSGKSEAVVGALWAAVLGGTARRYPSFLVIAKKREKWVPFRGVRGFLGIFSQADKIMTALETVASHIDDNNDSPLIVVIDDLQTLLSQIAGLQDLVNQITSAGRGRHMYVWMTTQIMGTREGSGGVSIDNNVTFRLVYKMMSGMTAHMATGQGEAGVMSLSGRPGDCLVVNRHDQVTRVATPYITKSAMDMLPVIGQPVDTQCDWFVRFKRAFQAHNARAEVRQAEQKAQERVDAAQRSLSKEEQMLLVARHLAPLDEVRNLTQAEVQVANKLLAQGVSQKTLVEYLYGRYGSHYRNKLIESLEGNFHA